MTGRFSRDQRIRKQREFDKLFKFGRRARGAMFGMWFYREKSGDSKPSKPKIAMMVSRKTAPSAVVRNCWKRKIREFFRLNQQKFNPSDQVLVQVRCQKPVPPLKIIEVELLALMEKIKERA